MIRYTSKWFGVMSGIVLLMFVLSEGRGGDNPLFKLPLEDHLVERQHAFAVNGKTINYTSRTGISVLKTEEGEPRAGIFHIAYTRHGFENPLSRPVTFVFNGGPGSSSVWLHLGLLGPKRVRLEDDGTMLPPPGELIDNEYSLLDETDLVFIDPVSTGYSRAADKNQEEAFHGFRGDLESVAEFIRLYVTRNGRWLSPKFILGESYGTTRAAGLSDILQEKKGMYLNGIILVSSVLQFQTIRFHAGNDLPYQLFFPSYTATAYYHGRLAPELMSMSLREVLDQSEEFVISDLAPALLAGTSLSDMEFSDVVSRAARLSGLSEEFVADSRLRINAFEFMKELRREENLTVGRLDSRFSASDKRKYGERYEFDPSNYQIHGPYTAAINHYLRSDLGFESDLPYEVLSSRVHPWDYDQFTNRYVDVAENLRRSLHINPHLHILIASGYYDLATPYFATDYTVRNLGLADHLQDNITTRYYHAGHMMYIRLESLKKQKNHLRDFYREVLEPIRSRR